MYISPPQGLTTPASPAWAACLTRQTAICTTTRATTRSGTWTRRGREDFYFKDIPSQIMTEGHWQDTPKWIMDIDDSLTKFFARNVAGIGPDGIVRTMDGRLIAMSESGTDFAYSEKVMDCMFFCMTALISVYCLPKASIATKSIDLSGTGEYGNVGGHHVHAKAAF